ncbi:MAG: single-stranded DNA-binding protein [Casimicrobium sp.]
MASVNKVIIIGNLGKDPELRYLPSGEAVASFSVATNETWKDKQGNKQERVDFHRIEFIGRTAEVCGEYLKKGMPVYIEGRIQYDKWTDKEGVEKTLTKIRGDRMQMLGSKGGDTSHDDGGGAPKPTPTTPSIAREKRKSIEDFDDDIPF